MKFYVEEDGHGEPCIWDAETPGQDELVLSRSSVEPDYWDAVVARLTSITAQDVITVVQNEVTALQNEQLTALQNVNDRAKAAARVQGAERTLIAAKHAATF